MIYHRVDYGLKCHIQVLPQYRKEHARDFAQMALNFGWAKNAMEWRLQKLHQEEGETVQALLKTIQAEFELTKTAAGI